MAQQNISQKLNELLQTKQNKAYFTAFMTVAFVVAMVIFGILPAYSAFAFQSEENLKRDDLITKLETKLDISKTLTNEYTSKGNMLSYLTQIFPDSSSQEDIVRLIKIKLIKNGAFFQGITFSLNTPDGGTIINTNNKVKKQLVNVLAQGSQTKLLNFIKELEESRRIFNISDIIITRKSEQEIAINTKGDYKLTAQIIYYYYDKTSTN